MYFLLFYVFFFLVSDVALAENVSGITANEGIGGVAENLMLSVNVLGDFFSSAAMVIGICFLFASLVKYKQHRDNPLFVPISTVVVLFILGLLLVLLPLLYKLTESGIPFSLFH